MFDPGIVPVVQSLVDLDVESADRGELDRAVELSERIRAWLDACDVAVVRRSKQLSRAEPGSSSTRADARDALSNRGRRDDRDTRAAITRGEVCEQMPGFEAGLVEGTITAGHVDALASATRGLSPAERSVVTTRQRELLDAAKDTPVDRFRQRARDIVASCTRHDGDDGEERLERQRRRRKMSRWTDRDTGMWKLLVELDPETGAKVSTAIDAKVAALCHRDPNSGTPIEHLATDAVVELLCSTGTGGDPDLRRVPEVCVHVDLQTLINGAHEHGLCELVDGTQLPTSTVMRLCCEADIVPIVIAPDGQPVDAGRTQRTANRKQRRLLRAMYRTCAHPNCTVGFDHCEIHHVTPWTRLGHTDMDDLIPICKPHHHLVHEGGWTLTMTPDRQITLRRPDGTIHYQGDTTDRPPGADPERRQAERSASSEPVQARTTSSSVRPRSLIS